MQSALHTQDICAHNVSALTGLLLCLGPGFLGPRCSDPCMCTCTPTSTYMCMHTWPQVHVCTDMPMCILAHPHPPMGQSGLSVYICIMCP